MLKLFNVILVLSVCMSCVPKIEQALEDNPSSYLDKKLDRKISSEKIDNVFDSLTVSMNTRIGDREYIHNVFVDIFGPSVDNVTTLPFILKNGPAFSGGCSQYEGSYSNSTSVLGAKFALDDPKVDCDFSNMNAPIVGGENSIREGLRIQACEKVVENATSLFYLIDNVTGVTNNPVGFATNPTDEHIKKIYSRFYPGRTIDAEVLTSLKNISVAPSLATAKDRFKLVALTVCMSADWQIP